MNEDRRLAVTLQNLAAKARDAVILDELPQTTARLQALSATASIAMLEEAQRKAKARRRSRP